MKRPCRLLLVALRMSTCVSSAASDCSRSCALSDCSQAAHLREVEPDDVTFADIRSSISFFFYAIMSFFLVLNVVLQKPNFRLGGRRSSQC